MIDFEEAIGRKTLFVEVILPLAVANTFTYRVPFELNNKAEIGKRTVVQFGKSKIYTAIILSVSQNPPERYEAKYLLDIIDDQPIVNPTQLNLWHWMANYYMCHLGEVMQAALPAALKLASETRIVLNSEGDYDKSELNDKEFVVVEALEIQKELLVSDINKILGQKNVFSILRSLFDKKAIFIFEEINQKYKPKTIALIGLNQAYKNPEALKQLFALLEKAPKQLDVLLAYLQLSKQNPEITKAQLTDASGATPAIIKALIDKDIFIADYKIVSRLTKYDDELTHTFTLNAYQDVALKAIRHYFNTLPVTLLYGVTASGKTQIYIRLIEEAIAQGKQVLYLLPEIALTTQIIERLKKYFADKIVVYHSKFNDNERAEVWQKVLKNECKVVLGARSAVFLPFVNLGLIIVDEEHEASYKQYDPSPRYNARDTAIVLAGMHKAHILLGSATPSIETYFNATTGKYGLVKLLKRYGGVQMPKIEVASIADETQKKLIKENFTTLLLTEMEQALAKKEQVIMFQNRRGYVPILICKTCGNTPKCINCDVSLTYHKTSNKMHCHYCGYQEDNIVKCLACGSTHIIQKGYGTEKIEDDIKILLPNFNVGRMDYDTTRNKNGHQHILSTFEEGKIDILVGTQMVAKGLDFGNVSTIGIINADTMLKFPDFRAYERTYQMLAQVAGRAGRRDKQGKVIIQAYDVKNRILQQVVDNDFDGMFSDELAERKQFAYPPYTRIIQIDVKHKDFLKLQAIADYFAIELRKVLGDKVLGPQIPLVGRIRTYYIQTIMIKVDKQTQSIVKVKEILHLKIISFYENKLNKGAFLSVDVDPY
ncbi:MAG: primosomal protein N' [Sphingobacteriales bacterium]|nr:MAG: primosomal protein N' [Sphingobacteriales bacterium]